jgi:hypothetical protein
VISVYAKEKPNQRDNILSLTVVRRKSMNTKYSVYTQ